MRTPILFAVVVASLALLTTASCSSTEEESPKPSPPDSGDTVLGDAGGEASSRDASTDSQPGVPACSVDGWCVTPLPDSDLSVKDVWPLEGRAFAVAMSPTVGVKVMEWTASTAAWSYIDDGTQNDSGLGAYVGSLWAPNENELYYTVSPGFVYHGTRGADATWTWTRHQLPNNAPNTDTQNALYDTGNPPYWSLQLLDFGFRGYPTLGVLGTGSGDVYAWFSNTIFHWKDDGSGTPAWVAEYSLDDATVPAEHMFFVGAGVSSSGEVWFTGARSNWLTSCAIVVRKTASGYARIADGTIDAPDLFSEGVCAKRTGMLPILGWMTDIYATVSGRIFGFAPSRGSSSFFRVRRTRTGRSGRRSPSSWASRTPISRCGRRPTPSSGSLAPASSFEGRTSWRATTTGKFRRSA
ncbi:hypothetical protein AKJ09_01353 [Labilithrix luteola]|uniref:Type IV fimbrial biogenesis protein PilY1 n=1 Tax=Labilithrix luteola TaxID=1391654 RepID=A0A0K1PNK6_9BACT|nr:hypothetical protein [Labilithrix luteola]AKU94689.1 hypothetical protein AKJ09_01353 [Labilithrix luteola]